jgi:flagellar basal-body rod protein FlgB
MTALTGPTTALIQFSLDAAQLQHYATAQNLANASTPGFRPYRVDFNQQFDRLRSAVAEGRPLSASMIASARPTLSQSDAPATVALDMEAAKLSQNVLHYQAVAKAYSNMSSLLSLAINEGRR